MGTARHRHRTNDAGFTVIECVIALSLVFVVLVILLGALTSGTRSLVTGRQRSTALALANQVMEEARSRAYGDVGHDLDSDPTLASDPLITGSAPNLLYTGVTPPEPLAGSNRGPDRAPRPTGDASSVSRALTSQETIRQVSRGLFRQHPER